MRFVVPDDFPPVYKESPTALDPLRERGEVEVFSTPAADVNELVDRLRDTLAVINVRAFTIFNAELLDRVPSLRLISILGTGTDNIDLPAASARGVVVVNTPGANKVSVAECTIALLFDAVKRISQMDRGMRAGEWKQIKSVDMRGKTLGLIGLGAIGQEVARMASAFGMRVITWSFNQDRARASSCGAELADFETVLRESHFLSLHLRASPQTQGIIGREQLALLRPGAVLVNTARGALVDTDALVDALKSGQLASAGLDVFTQEPLPADSPLRLLDNVVLTPHAAWVTEETTKRLEKLPVDNILAWLDGAPTNVVNPEGLQRMPQTK
jgi:phosphoglycerate dehydrogenase-like enzyme